MVVDVSTIKRRKMKTFKIMGMLQQWIFGNTILAYANSGTALIAGTALGYWYPLARNVSMLIPILFFYIPVILLSRNELKSPVPYPQSIVSSWGRTKVALSLSYLITLMLFTFYSYTVDSIAIIALLTLVQIVLLIYSILTMRKMTT